MKVLVADDHPLGLDGLRQGVAQRDAAAQPQGMADLSPRFRTAKVAAGLEEVAKERTFGGPFWEVLIGPATRRRTCGGITRLVFAARVGHAVQADAADHAPQGDRRPERDDRRGALLHAVHA